MTGKRRAVALGDSGSIPKRVIVIQLAIIAVLVILFKLYLPRMEKANNALQLQERETRIEQFFKSMVHDSGGVQTLRGTPSVMEVEQALGAPDTSSTDFRRGLHLRWIGTHHSLECSFNQGRLYYLMPINRRTGESVTASAPSGAGF